jgi:ornithine cyclodeaminase/alanine dehydrogenase-like protein (mu-crystallin family)
MLLLGEEDVSQLLLSLSQDECKQLMRTLSSALADFSTQSSSKSLSSQSENLIHQPLRSNIMTKHRHRSLFMPVSDTNSTGIKIVTISGRTGDIVGVINLFTPEGRLIGVLSATEITAFRTALVTMTLLSCCSNIPRRHLCIFGAGRQALWHARLALLLFPSSIKTITFVNRHAGRFENLVLPQDLPQVAVNFVAKEGNPAYDTQLRSHLSASDVVFCTTPSTQPLFPHEYLEEQPSQPRFISLIGSYQPHMQEIDSATLLSGGGRIYVDSKEACLAEAGELIMAGVKEEQLIELGELFQPDQKDSRAGLSEEAHVVFKCVGMALMDLTVAKSLQDMATKKGLGIDIPSF